jgi:predicted nucleotidyltransferase
MAIDEVLIQEIVRRILGVARPQRIILFGSAAGAHTSADSDIDLLIVEPDGCDRQREYVRIREALRGMGYPFDIILTSAEWFEASKEVVGGIAYPASKYGKVIYEAA